MSRAFVAPSWEGVKAAKPTNQAKPATKVKPTPLLGNFGLADTVDVLGCVTKLFGTQSVVTKGYGENARFEVTDAAGKKLTFRGRLLASAFGFGGLVVVRIRGKRCGFTSAKLSADYAIRSIEYIPSIPNLASLWPYCWSVAEALVLGRNPQQELQKRVKVVNESIKQSTLDELEPSKAPPPKEASKIGTKTKQQEIDKMMSSPASLAKGLLKLISETLPLLKPDKTKTHPSVSVSQLDKFKYPGGKDLRSQPSRQKATYVSTDQAVPPRTGFPALRHVQPFAIDLVTGEPSSARPTTEAIPLHAVFLYALVNLQGRYPWLRELVEGPVLATYWASQFTPLLLRVFCPHVLWRMPFALQKEFQDSLLATQSTVPFIFPAGNTVPPSKGRVAETPREPATPAQKPSPTKTPPLESQSDAKLLTTPGRPVLSLLLMLKLNFMKDPKPPTARDGRDGREDAPSNAGADLAAFFGVGSRAGSTANDWTSFMGGASPDETDEWHDTGVPMFLLTQITEAWFRNVLLYTYFTSATEKTANTAVARDSQGRLVWPERIAQHFDGYGVAPSASSDLDKRSSAAERFRSEVLLLQKLSKMRTAAIDASRRPRPTDEHVNLQPLLHVKALLVNHAAELKSLCAEGLLFTLECPPPFPGFPPVSFVMRREDWDRAIKVLDGIPLFIEKARTFDRLVESTKHGCDWLNRDFCTPEQWARGETTEEFRARQMLCRDRTERLLGSKLSPEQKDALLDKNTPSLAIAPFCAEQSAGLASICANPITLITGNPGTGKSSIGAALNAIPELTREQVGLPAADTGESSRVQQANILGLAPTVLITLLNADRFGGTWRTSQGLQLYWTMNPDGCSERYSGLRLILVDEAGMKSEEDVLALLEFAQNQVPGPGDVEKMTRVLELEGEAVAPPGAEGPPAKKLKVNQTQAKPGWGNQDQASARKRKAQQLSKAFKDMLDAEERRLPTRMLTRLVFVGDPKQLPSVSPGGVIEVLREIPGVNHVHLVENHRASAQDLVGLTLLFCQESETTREEDREDRKWMTATSAAEQKAEEERLASADTRTFSQRLAEHRLASAARQAERAAVRLERRAENRAALTRMATKCISQPAGGRELAAIEGDPEPSLRFFDMDALNTTECVQDVAALFTGPDRHEVHCLSFTNKACTKMHNAIAQACGLTENGAPQMVKNRLVPNQRVQFQATWPQDGHGRFHNQDLVDLLLIEDYPLKGPAKKKVGIAVANTDVRYDPSTHQRLLTFAYVGTGKRPAPTVTVKWTPDLLECVSGDKGFCTTVHTKQGGQCEHIVFFATNDDNPLMLTAMSRAREKLWVYAAPGLSSNQAMQTKMIGLEGVKLVVEVLNTGLGKYPRPKYTAFSLAQQYRHLVAPNEIPVTDGTSQAKEV